jgi:hypothetical protein
VKSIPLTPDALEVLQRAWDAAEPGDLLFPRPGQPNVMRSEYSKTSRMVKAAMVRAGLVEGWQHVCRRGCDEKQIARDEQQRRCSKCNAILWPKPIVRNVRFHDLRHSTADHLLEHGVELADVSAVSEALGHRDHQQDLPAPHRRGAAQGGDEAVGRHAGASPRALMQGQSGEVARGAEGGAREVGTGSAPDLKRGAAFGGDETMKALVDTKESARSSAGQSIGLRSRSPQVSTALRGRSPRCNPA